MRNFPNISFPLRIGPTYTYLSTNALTTSKRGFSLALNESGAHLEAGIPTADNDLPIERFAQVAKTKRPTYAPAQLTGYLFKVALENAVLLARRVKPNKLLYC